MNFCRLNMNRMVIQKFLAFFNPAVENCRQFLLLRTDISQKTVVGSVPLDFVLFSQQLNVRLLDTFRVVFTCK